MDYIINYYYFLMNALIEQLMANDELKNGRYVVIVKHENGFWKSTWFDVNDKVHSFSSNFIDTLIDGMKVELSHITSIKYTYNNNIWEKN